MPTARAIGEIHDDSLLPDESDNGHLPISDKAAVVHILTLKIGLNMRGLRKRDNRRAIVSKHRFIYNGRSPEPVSTSRNSSGPTVCKWDGGANLSRLFSASILNRIFRYAQC
jgi:hypothetical protein